MSKRERERAIEMHGEAFVEYLDAIGYPDDPVSDEIRAFEGYPHWTVAGIAWEIVHAHH